MSFETILIHRDMPIINGFVQVPYNKETDKTRVTADEATNAIADSVVTRLSMGSGKQTGSKFGAQEFFRLPGLAPNDTYVIDPVTVLSAY